MAVKRYDGSAWQVVAGKGDQGTSSSISTWVKTASGGETSLSGNDDNSQALSYTVGQELVFINGTLLKRGSDYTATDGTTITGLAALAANDVATVWTVTAFSVTGAIANTIVDAKGDLITASGADVPARLAVGSNGQVLTADSAEALGVKWAAASSGALVLVSRQSFSSVANTGTTFDDVFTSTYKNYQIVIEDIESTTNNTFLYFQYRYAGPTTQAGSYYGSVTNYDHNGTTTNTTIAGAAQISMMKIGYSGSGTNGQVGNYYVSKVGASGKPAITGQGAGNATTGAFNLGCTQDTQRIYTGFILSAAAGNITGTVAIYGLATA